ncbi:flavin reductase [Sphaerisporangium rufum]|uniref:Flavin reductase n=1 Tax=Sphaerisporangium rufum TaxID=1381558 RepID=A0A919QY32_9ACTN|nr:flavin reductase family protein [Sphaerisporangium rufum]GII76204.1 flavin reductase [Sphaerisporangium rufum]
MDVDNSTTVRPVADARSLRRAFGTFATGVTVVTTGGDTPHAMTANSFTSVSLDPPLVLICVDRGAVMHRCLTETGYFGVSVLAAHQEDAALHFANRWRTLGAAQFDDVDWLPGGLTGVPLLDGTLASFECELWRTYDGGDHTIFIGKILTLHQQTDRDALLVFKGKFRQLSPDWSEVPA